MRKLFRINFFLFLRYFEVFKILCITAFISFFCISSVNAVEDPQITFNGGQNETISSALLNDEVDSQLEEVPPPGAVQQLRKRLDEYDPQVKLLNPSPGSVIPGESWNLIFELKDWPLANDPEVGLGPHLVIQLDEEEPIRIATAEDNKIEIPMKRLSPGSHRIGAYASYPWGEAVKKPNSSFQFQIHSVKQLIGTQPSSDMPWIMVTSPFESSPFQPLLIDSLIWNAPIQNINENDLLWHLRISVNGKSFLMTRPEAIWVNTNAEQKNIVQFELIDSFGDPIHPVFNNFLREVSKSKSIEPIWMQSKITEEEISKFLGQSNP